MCCFNGLLCVLVCRHGGVVVHLQTLGAVLSDLFILDTAAALAALAAAAAVFAAEAEGRGHHAVPRLHGVQGPGQEVPVAQEVGQVAGASRLHHVDDDHEDNQHNDGHANAHHDLPASERQAKH